MAASNEIHRIFNIQPQTLVSSNRRQSKRINFLDEIKCEVKSAQLLNSLWIADTVSAFIVQPVRAEVVQVNEVELKPTDSGLELILETTSGKPLQIFTSSYGATFVAQIINTQLALPESNSFRSNNPTEGITAVTVTQHGATSIRVSVIGKAGLPKAEVIQSECAECSLCDRGLVLSLTAPADTTAERPKPTLLSPDSQTTQEPAADREAEQTDEMTEYPAQQSDQTADAPTEQAEEDEPIEILVTGEQENGYSVQNATSGTRTDTSIRDIPQSIQVVPEQVLEDQVEYFTGSSYGDRLRIQPGAPFTILGTFSVEF